MRKGRCDVRKFYQQGKCFNQFIFRHLKTCLTNNDDLFWQNSMKNFKEFSDAVEAVKNKGVVVAVASPDDVTASNKEKNGFFNVKNVL